MTPEEFYDRTKLNLVGDEYAKVESIYTLIPVMDKDDFCAEWLPLKDNPLMKEIAEGAWNAQHRETELKSEIRRLKAQIEEMKKSHEEELKQIGESHEANNKDFVKRLIKAGEYDMPKDIYDVIEEECGITFIIRSKWEQSIDLSEEEIDYMVKKLK